MGFPKYSSTGMGKPYGTADNPNPPKSKVGTGTMKGGSHDGHHFVHGKGPGTLNHNPRVNMHHHNTDSNSPKSNKNKGQSA